MVKIETIDKSNNSFLWVYFKIIYNKDKLVINIKPYLRKIFFGWLPNKVWKSRKPLAVVDDAIWIGAKINSIILKSNLYEKCVKNNIVTKQTKKILKKLFL